MSKRWNICQSELEWSQRTWETLFFIYWVMSRLEAGSFSVKLSCYKTHDDLLQFESTKLLKKYPLTDCKHKH